MRVIAIAYGEKPLDRVATGETRNLIYVAAASTENAHAPRDFSGVGFPRESVYLFDAAVFEALIRAAGNEQALKSLLDDAARPERGCLPNARVLQAAA